MDRNNAFVIPTYDFHPLLEYLNTTEKEDHGSYWHLHIYEGDNGELSLLMPKQKNFFPLTHFAMTLSESVHPQR